LYIPVNQFLDPSDRAESMEDDEEFDAEVIDELEFAKAVLEFMKKERAAIKKGGVDVDRMIEELEDLLQQTEDSKAHLDDLKRRMVMEMSKSLIGVKGAPASSTDHLDMAAKEMREAETAEEYFKRVKRRTTHPNDDTANA
jgi:hypothetical protein